VWGIYSILLILVVGVVSGVIIIIMVLLLIWGEIPEFFFLNRKCKKKQCVYKGDVVVWCAGMG
jgi:hypothetical protein